MQRGVAMIDQNARNTAMWCHLSSLVWVVSFLIAIPLPFASVFVPLIIWQSNREQPFVDAHGKESINFHLSLILYAIGTLVALIVVAAVVFAVIAVKPNSDTVSLVAIGGALAFVGWLILGIVLAIFDVIVTIVAAAKASNGEFYRYPFTIRLLK
jgi:uncharacterized protein